MVADAGDAAAVTDANPLVTLLGRCTVRIDCDGRFAGTGFFVAPGEVLTCAHLVHGCTEVTVYCEGGARSVTGTVKLPDLAVGNPDARFYPLPDAALLRLADPPRGHPCVRLEAAEPAAGPTPDVLRVAAYTRDEHESGGVARTSATLEYEGPVQEREWRLLKLKGGQVVRGFSGAALLNTRTGGVCGLVDSTRDERSDLGGFGVPLAAFLDQLPGLRERNAAHHAAWDRAVEEERRLAAERAGGWDRLPLDRPLAALDWDTEASRADLLRPRYAAVPFTGREDLLDQLMRWRERDDRLSVVVLVGAGGFGKTRTAVEACVAAQRAGWSTGLLAVEDPGQPGVELDTLADWPGRLVVVVDYAETRPDLVAGLVRRLLRRPDRPPARLVLVVRQAVTRRQLEELFAVGPAREELTGVLRRAEVVRLDSDAYELDRAELFERAIAAFAGPLGRPGWRGRGPALRAEHFARPLFVLVAALAAVEDERIDVDALSADELLIEVLDRHEAQYWARWNDRLGAGLHPDDQRRAVALAALLGADTEEEAAGLVRLLPGFADSSGERARAVVRWLAHLYGSGRLDAHPVVRPLEPGLLAEVLIAREWSPSPSWSASAWTPCRTGSSHGCWSCWAESPPAGTSSRQRCGQPSTSGCPAWSAGSPPAMSQRSCRPPSASPCRRCARWPEWPRQWASCRRAARCWRRWPQTSSRWPRTTTDRWSSAAPTAPCPTSRGH